MKEFERLYTGLNTPNIELMKSNNKTNNELYAYMWGPDELKSSGTLKNFDLTARLHEITLPVLLLYGTLDIPSAEQANHVQSLFKNADLKFFSQSAHLPIWTEQEEYLQTIIAFLQKNS